MLLDDFKEQLQRVQEMYEDSKRIGDGLKMKNEEKLTSQDQDQEREYTELEVKQASVIKKLQE